MRERAINALGRIGSGDFQLIMPYWDRMMVLANDKCSDVRMNFIWANENIATNTPKAYKDCIPIFLKLLDDENRRVRIEAPEMFRVLGKRKPEYVIQCVEKLRYLAENDEERVVRIHAKGAIKAINDNKKITKT